MELEGEIQSKLDRAIAGMPVVFRMIARRAVLQRSERLAEENGRSVIGEEEVAHAFFLEVPKAFKGQMKKLLDDVGIDYRRYELK
jgi:hypothetical protein